MQNWLLLSIIAPFLWAVVAIIDIQFVDDVYEDEYDGTVISGIFQILPWLLVPLGIVEFAFPEIEVALLAFLSGGVFILSFFFYFKALFISNDGALMEILWGVSVLVVPFFAWLLVNEVLTSKHYFGIILAFVGIFLFNFDGKIKQVGFYRILVPMTGAVIFLALSMVISRMTQESAINFWSTYLLFSAGVTVFSFLILACRKKSPLKKAREIFKLSQKYFPFFLLAEGLSNLATFASQRAIGLAPAVSFVIVIESLVPVFVMAISLVIVLFFRNIKKININLYRDQLVGARLKGVALLCIVIGISIVV